MSETITQTGFQTLGLPTSQLNTLNRLGFVTPTPIQENAIPVALTGRDVVGIAQTGTGKTLAFGLPMLARLKAGQNALVIAPTRELAQQIEDSLRALGASTVLLIGGASMHRQVQQLRARPTVFVATPGRLIDHLQQRTIRLDRVGVVVLDEADRMLDMGFAPAIRRILDVVPLERQTMLFSATMPKEIAELAQRYLRDPIRVEIARAGTATELVSQELLVVLKEEKNDVLKELLYENPGTVLVFARTRHGARKLARTVRELGHSAAELHSDRTLAQRKAALDGFKKGAYRVLVATDIAARGIDVKEIALVVNFDLPDNPEDYVHRIGRTGRAGASGRAVTLATPDQGGDVRDIERLIKTELPVSERSRAVIDRPRPPAPRGGGPNRRGGGGGASFRPRGR
ncbi:MAG: DEAD/DEAH box helicase [Fimbriimonas sp.]